MAIINGKIHYTSPFSIVMLNYQRVQPTYLPTNHPTNGCISLSIPSRQVALLPLRRSTSQRFSHMPSGYVDSPVPPMAHGQVSILDRVIQVD
jgi:hypothetical protein